jgi:hypothetical protein
LLADARDEMTRLNPSLALAGDVTLLGDGVDPAKVAVVSDLDTSIRALEAERDDLLKNSAAARNLTDSERQLAGAKRQTREEVEKLTAKLSGERRALEIDELRTRNRIAAEIARTEVDAYDTGTTDSARVQNREAALRQLIAQKESALAQGGMSEVQQQNILVALVAQRAQLVETILDTEKERARVLKEEQESQRKLLTAGPAEMLKRIVADRFAQRGVTPGQFFSFDPSFREAILEAQDRRKAQTFQNSSRPLTDVQSEVIRLNEQRARDLLNLGRQQARGVRLPTDPGERESSATGAASAMNKELSLLTQGLVTTRTEFALTGQALVSFREDLALVAGVLQGGFGKGQKTAAKEEGPPYNPAVHG